MGFGVVIVNYNTGALALDAALSVLGDEPSAHVVIVDNVSTDHSVDYFREVFSGKRTHRPDAPDRAPARVNFAAIDKISGNIIDEGSDIEGANSSAGITVIQAHKNGGFGAGCNIGLHFIQRLFDPDYFLLLNPDAVIAAGTIDAFRARLADANAGLCGASILRFEDPNNAQALGGAAMNNLTLLGNNLGAGLSTKTLPSPASIEKRMSYPLGAAISFRKEFLDRAGFFDERYFLYYEEVDLVRRGAPEFQPAWAPDAIVYHRHGASAGSRQEGGGRSVIADFHMARSRMLFAKKWRPVLTPFLLVLSCIQACRRVLRGRPRQAGAILRGAFGAAAN